MKRKTNYKKILCGLVFFIISSALASASTTVIVVKFKPQTIHIPVGQKEATLADIDENRMQIKKYFEVLSNDIEFEKLIPKAKPADTLFVNKKGEIKKLNDWSQVFRVTIPNSAKNIMDVIDDLVKFQDVEYAEPPVQIKFELTPNDLHKEGNQWSLTKINAEDAWDITTGSSSITIAVIEEGVASHTDIDDKLTGGDGGSSGYHGLMVAGVAGCETNNNTELASLGYNTMIIPKNYASGGIATDIRDAADPSEDDADIINCSFKTVLYDGDEYSSYNYSSVEYAVEDAIAWDKIVVASAGNPPNTGGGDQDEVPFTQWPAAYPGVIGVSATNSSDTLSGGYNYGNHVDLSAPGINIRVLDSNDGYSTQSGTSLSAPLVCALAALILSNDNSLTPTQVQETMELSAVDLGTTGRDDYYGYGRIDAYEAVRNLYVPDEYTTIESALNNASSGQTILVSSGSHSVNNNATVSSGVTLKLNPGVTVSIASGKKITVNGILSAQGSYNNEITFQAQSGTWYGIEVNSTGHFNPYYCNFEDAQYPIRYYSSDGSIERCDFTNYTRAVKYDNYSSCDFIRYSTFIEYNTTGIEYTQYSGGNVRSYNQIQTNYYGVKIDNTSSPHLGCYAGQGYNSIYNLMWDVYSTNASSIMAQYNYWGGGDPSIYGNVTWEPALDEDPTLSKRTGRMAEEPIVNAVISYADTVGFKEFDRAHLLYLEGKTEEALALFRELVDRYPDYNVGRQSLAFEYRILRKENRKSESETRMLTVSSIYEGKEISGLANSIRVDQLLKNGDFRQAVSIAEDVVAKFPDTNLEKYSLYDLGTIHWYYLGDQKTGESYYRKLIANYPKDDLSISALATLGEWVPPEKEEKLEKITEINTIPSEFSLDQNYPNPFNPETYIDYSVPKDSKVRIEVYNVLGEKVAVLVDETKVAGFHTAHWDGRYLSGKKATAGIYLCRMRARQKDGLSAGRQAGMRTGDFVKTQKMTLLP